MGNHTFATSPVVNTGVFLTLPTADGSSGQVVTTNGSGVLSFANGSVPDDAITLAKMAPGTDGNIISYDTSGNPVAVATGNDGQVLTSAGAGAVPTFETLPAGTTLSGSTNNTVATVTGANALVGEANLTFDGSTLGVAGAASITRSGGTPVLINRTSNFGELIKFRKDGSDIGKIDCTSAGIGIYLGGTAAANALDDYEEGTFTPAVSQGSLNDYYGFYTKIGNLVNFTLIAGIFSNVSSSADLLITGFPFSSAGTSNKQCHFVLMTQKINASNDSTTGFMSTNASQMEVFRNGNNGTTDAWLNLRYTDLGSGAYFRCSGHYYTD
jgi:hypothetical protein